MTTINDVTFNMVNLRPVAVHRNSISEQPGSDTNFITDMGYDGLVLRLEGYEESLATYDSVISEFMKSGEQTLVHRTGWQFKVYSVQLTPELIEGIVDNYFPYDLILYTSTPYRESTTLDCRAKKITANNQEWSAEDIPCTFIDNWDFEDWTAGTSVAPDNWIDSSLTSISRSTTHKTGSYSAQLTPNAGSDNLYQSISLDFTGKELTFGCWVYSAYQDHARIALTDDTGTTYSSFHSGGSTWGWLTVTRTIDSGTAYIRAGLYPSHATAVAYFDGAVLVEGDSIQDNTFIRDIDTDGSVDAVPDIQVIGGATHANLSHAVSDSNYNSNAGAATVTISNYSGTSSPNVNVSTSQGQTVNCRKAGLAIIDSIEIYAGSAVSWGNVTCTVYDKVGGTSLGSKIVNITGVGDWTFTFATPIAVVQDEENCTDSVDASKIYFKFTSSANISIGYNSAYADGIRYENDVVQVNDLGFVVEGHSCKEIRQTFTVPVVRKLSIVTLSICKYNYAGSNPATVVVKEGATTLGTGTAVLSGSTFVDEEFYLEEESANSLTLATSTTYTIIFTPPSGSVNATSILIDTDTAAGYSDGSVTLVEDGGTTRTPTHDLYFILGFSHSNEDVQVYNTADTSVKSDVANEILESATHRINIDGTGTIDFDDDFTTDRYARTNEGMTNVTHDTGDNELDIADDGYIYWLIDSKGPVTGTPTLTAQINITTGTPTIQISTDASTWYDITTAIVDDVNTIYELDSSGLHLKGKTLFYWRFDCVKAGAATCSIKSFKLDVNLVTIDFEHPIITADGAASTFRCDQDADSGMNCTVALYYRGRSWPA